MPNTLITGSNRGIGQEWVQKVKQSSDTLDLDHFHSHTVSDRLMEEVFSGPFNDVTKVKEK